MMPKILRMKEREARLWRWRSAIENDKRDNADAMDLSLSHPVCSGDERAVNGQRGGG